MSLELIIARGFSSLQSAYGVAQFDYSNVVTARDGFQISIIAGPGCYCTPRPTTLPSFEPSNLMGEQVLFDYPGPYTAVECGFPTERPEPWEPIDGDLFWKQYAEDEDNPTETVYSFVPVDMVRALIRLHGGEDVDQGWGAEAGPNNPEYRARLAVRSAGLKQLAANLEKQMGE